MRTRASFIFSFAILLLISFQGNSQWVQQMLPAGTGVSGIFMVNNNTGYLAGASGNKVLKTTNGGNNWNVLPGAFSVELSTVFFLNENTGFAAGRVGAVYKTTNGGINWISLSAGTSQRILYLDFVDQSTGYASGTGGLLKRTTNSGLNWTDVGISCLNNVMIEFMDPNTGFAVCSGSLYRTSNMGANWLTIQVTPGGIWDISMIDMQTGYALGANPRILYKTTNSGINWQVSGNSFTGPAEKLMFISMNTGYAFGGYFTPPNGPSSFLVKTTNAGLNWYQQTLPIATYLVNVFFPSPDTGFAIGTFGVAATGNGGGPISVQQISSNVPNEYSLLQNYPNPFNPVTSITFSVPVQGNIKLSVFDITGRELEILIDQNMDAGEYKAEWNAAGYSSGIYIYSIITKDFTETRKMILVK